MKVIQILRRAHREVATRPFGVSARMSRIWRSQVEAFGTDSIHMSLPFRAGSDGSSIEGMESLQDPATGQVYFMFGISEWGGDDSFAPPSDLPNRTA